MRIEQGDAEPLRVGIQDAAQVLGISRTRIFEHVKAGRLKKVKDGHRTLFLMTELRRFVAQQERDGR